MHRGAAVLLLLLGLPAARGEVRDRSPTPAPSVEFDAALDFEENLGQADPAVRYLARGRGFLALFTERDAVFACGGGPDLVRMGFPGARAGGYEPGPLRPGHSHYPPRVTGARRFGEILRPALWPGVDLLWTGGGKRALEYSFRLAPGADPARIALSFEGGRAAVAGSGDLLVAAPGGTLRQGRPRAFQGEDPVPVEFFPRPDGTVGFVLGRFDPARPLVIDPEVVFAASHGGSASDEAWAVATDPAGNLYFAGWAVSTNLPVSAGAFQAASAGNFDAFVTKRTPRGAALSYATYLGGGSADLAYALTVDADGKAVVAGGTQSADFPSTAGAFQPARATGAETGFVAKLAVDGKSLAWSTFLGGSVREAVRGIRPWPGGGYGLVGTTASPDFPLALAAQPGFGGATDAFAARLAADGAALPWATFLGGALNEEGRALGLGADGTCFVAGTTESADFPDAAALQPTLSGPRDAFAAAYAPGGSVAWATCLGGSGEEEGWGLTVDASGSPWVVGYTTSADFPLASPVDSLFAGQHEGFAAKFAADGSARLMSTFLGGDASDKAEAACTDAAGVVYVVGRTASADFPVKDAVDRTYGGGDYDAFVTAFTPGGTQVLWSTYWGAGGTDFAMAAAVDSFFAVVVAGRIEGTDGDGLELGIIAVPLPPSFLSAAVTGLARVRLSWADSGIREDGYTLERREGAGPWTVVATLPGNSVQYADAALVYGTTYTWRVRAFNGYGTSGWSPEATATTLPYPSAPPAAPTGLVVVSSGPRFVDLAWTDNASEEDVFVLERFDPYAGFFIRAILDRNVTSFHDAEVQPMRDYRYRVRAVNPLGSSGAPEATATLGPSFDLAVLSGRRRTRDGPGRDSLVLSGELGRTNATDWDSLVMTQLPFELRLGADPVALVSLPAEYLSWKQKKGKWVLRFPFSDRGKVTIVVDPLASTFRFTVTGADLLDAPEGPEEVRLLMGPDGSSEEIPWVPRKRAGDYSFP